MPDNLDPWTSRESTKLRGLPIQKDPAFCFQNQLLDVRFGQVGKFYGLPSSRDPLENEFTDVTQSCWRQNAAGGFVLLSRSRLYWPFRDRMILPSEHLLLNGWPDGMNLEELDTPIPEIPTETDLKRMAQAKAKGLPAPAPRKPPKATAKGALKAPAKKRGRRCVHMRPKWGPKAVDLAGNGMIMGDLATACYSMRRCAKTSLMEFLFGAPARTQNPLC